MQHAMGLLEQYYNTNPEELAIYKGISIHWLDLVQNRLGAWKREGHLPHVEKIRYRFRGKRSDPSTGRSTDGYTLRRTATTFSVYYDRKKDETPTYAPAAVQRVKTTQDLEALATICQARLSTPEFALMQAFFDQQAEAVKELKHQLGTERADHQNTYEILQEVGEVRDMLLTHVYRLLKRPNGILLKDMPEAMRLLEHEASTELLKSAESIKSLQARNVVLVKHNLALRRENTQLHEDAKHDHKIVGDLYGELGDLYKRLAVNRYEER